MLAPKIFEKKLVEYQKVNLHHEQRFKYRIGDHP